MKKKQELTEEQRKEIMKKQAMKDFKERVENGQIPQPTRLFKVGDEVKIGALQNITITEILFDGMGYAVHYDYEGQSYGKPIQVIGDVVWEQKQFSQF